MIKDNFNINFDQISVWSYNDGEKNYPVALKNIDSEKCSKIKTEYQNHPKGVPDEITIDGKNFLPNKNSGKYELDPFDTGTKFKVKNLKEAFI